MESLAAYADSDDEPTPSISSMPAPPTLAQAPASIEITPQGALLPAHPAAPSSVPQHVANHVSGITSLPNDGWVEYKTAQGASYFFHIHSNFTTWERPAVLPVPIPVHLDQHLLPQPKPAASGPRKPVSWEPIPNSEWRHVLMSDGERVYYNPRTKVSSWSLPTDAVVASQLPALTPAVPTPDIAPIHESAQPSIPVMDTHVVTAKIAEIGQKRSIEDGGSQGAKAVRVETDETTHGAEVERRLKAIEDKKAEEERKLRELETEAQRKVEEDLQQREAFRAMLREKNLGLLSRWDTVLPQLAFDSRFTAIPKMADRRAEFDAFIRTRGEEERTAKIAVVQRLKEARLTLSTLLESRVTASYGSGCPTLSELRKRHGTELAFTGGIDTREQERSYNERIEALRKSEEVSKQATHKRFVELLLEKLRPDEADSWRSAKRILSKQDEKWDAAFGSISENRRADLFDEFERELRNRRHALRQRENEGRREREAVERDMERRRSELSREESVNSLRSAMRERCRSIDLTWVDAVRLLTGDPRFESTALREGEKAELFLEHQDQLRAHLCQEYRAWLVEQNAIGVLQLGVAFSGLEARLDKRFKPLPEAERVIVFDKLMSDLLTEAKDDMLRLLRETRQLHREVTPSGDLDGIRRLLDKDLRYLRLAPYPAEREAAIVDYIRTQAPAPPSGGQLRAQLEAQEEEINPTMPRFTVAMVGQSEKELGF